MHLIAQQWSEVNGVAGKLQEEKLESLAPRQRDYEDRVLAGSLLQRFVHALRNGGHKDVLLLVVVDPDVFDLVGGLVLQQVDLHYVAEFLVRQFAG